MRSEYRGIVQVRRDVRQGSEYRGNIQVRRDVGEVLSIWGTSK